MNTQLDPRTRRKLEAFARRRRQLLAVRGACVLVGTLLAAMMVVALVDRLLVLPELARLGLSATAYVLTLAAFYRASLRWLLKRPALADLARMFEADRLDLREEVLSAVELGGSDPGAASDSPGLRHLIQQRVAVLVEPYQPVQMLPARRVGRWIATALVAILLCLGLSAIPALRFPQLMARAFLPTANIGRVSSLRITILEPGETDVSIPRGDPVGVVVELSDATTGDVILESYTAGTAARNVIRMEPTGGGRYGTTVVVAEESLHYRVFAGKAATRFYTIHSCLRPHITGFHKTYRYPVYSGLQDQEVSEPAGDLLALQGTTVDLQIEADQPIAGAELWIDVGQRRQVIPLNVANAQLLVGQLQLQQSGTYRVHLVAQDTGFDNKFAPNYELMAVADLVPDVRLREPNENKIMPSDALVALAGSAADDIGLTEVRHLVRVNQGPWQQAILGTGGGKSFPVQTNWDLQPLGLQSGDIVATKLEATDLKGNVGESVTVQITIGSSGYSAERIDTLAARKQLQEAFGSFADGGKKLRESLKSLQEAVQNDPSGGDKQRLLLQSARREADQLEESGLKAWGLALAAARQEQMVNRAQDVVLTGRLLSRLRRDVLARTRAEMDDLERLAVIPRKAADELMNMSGPLDWQANQLVQAHKRFLAEAQVDLIAGEVFRLAANETQMLEQARADSRAEDETLRDGVWIRLGRQQQGASREQEQIQGMIDELTKWDDPGRTRQIRDVAQRLSADQRAMDDLLKAPSPGPDALAQRSEQRRQALDATLKALWSVRQVGSSQASKSRDDLAKAAGVTADELATLRWRFDSGVNEQKTLQRLQGQANVEPGKLETQRDKSRTAVAEAEQRWGSCIELLQDRAGLEDAHTQADYPFIVDAADTAAALAGLHTTAFDPDTTKQTGEAISKIEKAYRVLDVGHGIIEKRNHLRDMMWRERWEWNAQDRRREPLRSWLDWEIALRACANLMPRSGFDKPTEQKLKEIMDSATLQSIRGQAEKRRNDGTAGTSVAREMEALTQSMTELVELLGPQMEQARKVIAAYAPSLAQQLRAAAQAANEIKKDTQSVIDGAKERSGSEVQTQAGDLRQDQLGMNERLDGVRAALQRDANQQELGDEQARQRARDDDDALALLRPPTPPIEESLGEAAATTESAAQQQALSRALEQQGKLSAALELLAQHYENLEAGQPEPTRTALRAAEQDSQVTRDLERQYQQAQSLAQLSEMPREQLGPTLENELMRNDRMRQELGRIEDTTLRQAARSLKQMVDQEQDIGNRLKGIAEQQSRNGQPLQEHNQRMSQLQERARALARQAQRLANTDIPAMAEQARQVGDAAQPSFSDARQAAQKASEQMPKEFRAAPGTLAQQVEQFAATMNTAGNDLNAAAQKTESSARKEAGPQAEVAAQRTRDVSRQVDESATQARQLAADLRATAQSNSAQLQHVDQQQGQVNEMAGPVTEGFRQAADLAQRLGLPETGALRDTAKAMESISEKELPRARETLEQSPAAQPAQEPVEQARGALAGQWDKVQKMLPPPPVGEPAATASLSEQEQAARWMARALDQLEAAELAQGSRSPAGQQATPEAGQVRQTLQQPLRSQQAAMAQSRAQSNSASRNQRSGPRTMASRMSSNRTNPNMPPPTGQPLPEQVRLRGVQWGQLRELEATDMVESRGEAVAEEYRDMVHAYFDAISRQAKDK